MRTEDFDEYCRLRDSDKAFYLEKGCKLKWMNVSSDERKQAGIDILWPVISNIHYKEALEEAARGNSPNNISPIIQYSCGVKALWMGEKPTSWKRDGYISTFLLPTTGELLARYPRHG